MVPMLATAFLASSVPKFPAAGVRTMSFSAANAAAARMRQLSSSLSQSASPLDVNDSTSSTSTSAYSSSTVKPLHPPKRVLLLRHGQAAHNPRAEAARENGCSFETFLQLMTEDDQFDSALTELGVNQAIEAGRQERVRHALRNVEMVVSSPLSRALRTADLVHPLSSDDATEGNSSKLPRRVCIEDFREINGKLLNAQRRPRSDLEGKFPHWCFEHIPDSDESWTEEKLESREACSDRGYSGLLWIMQQREDNVLLVCHGGLLGYTMNHHSNVVLLDGRSVHSEKERCITKRFGNCELREFVITVWEPSAKYEQTNGMNGQPVITLEEVSMDGNEYDEKKVQMV